MAVQYPRKLQKTIKGTNIIVQKDRIDGLENENLRMLYLIDSDDPVELIWFHKTLRPRRNLIAASELFLQGVKDLHPAVNFKTFDLKKSKLRRLRKQQKHVKKALERRKEMAPTAAYKAAVNPHKVPRIGGRLPEDEERFLSRGMKQKKKKGSESESKESPQYFTNWRKKKISRIGKAL